MNGITFLFFLLGVITGIIGGQISVFSPLMAGAFGLIATVTANGIYYLVKK